MNVIMSTSVIDESAILARVIGSDKADFPPSVAVELLKWGFKDADRQRMSELAEKARQGTLNREEQAESEVFERVSSFLGIVKSKARLSLQTSADH